MKIMASSPINSWQIEQWKQWQTLFFWTTKSLQMVIAAMKSKYTRHLLLGRKVMTNLDSILKSIEITLLTILSSQSYGFFSSHVWMWELDHKESWVPKNWCFWTVVLEKTLASPLDSKIKPVNLKGNQPWIFIGRTDAEATWRKEPTHW